MRKFIVRVTSSLDQEMMTMRSTLLLVRIRISTAQIIEAIQADQPQSVFTLKTTSNIIKTECMMRIVLTTSITPFSLSDTPETVRWHFIEVSI